MFGPNMVDKYASGTTKNLGSVLDYLSGSAGNFFYHASILCRQNQKLRTPKEEMAFTARPNIQSQSQIFRYD